mmetsp:Transcript_112069/g.322125  ORF Transcript_112069/g.322125 Transcript_112069/m.322125 type:complete len:236 (+) Transcript_112069:338-1045(+)
MRLETIQMPRHWENTAANGVNSGCVNVKIDGGTLLTPQSTPPKMARTIPSTLRPSRLHLSLVSLGVESAPWPSKRSDNMFGSDIDRARGPAPPPPGDASTTGAPGVVTRASKLGSGSVASCTAATWSSDGGTCGSAYKPNCTNRTGPRCFTPTASTTNLPSVSEAPCASPSLHCRYRCRYSNISVLCSLTAKSGGGNAIGRKSFVSSSPGPVSTKTMIVKPMSRRRQPKSQIANA